MWPPLVADSTNALLDGGIKRAADWGYPQDGPWTVTLRVPEGSREVHKPAAGTYQIGKLIAA
jgi:hypothetical protein